MSNCPECNKAMGLHDLFVAGLCPGCAGKYITQQAKRIAELGEAIECFLDRWKKSGPQGSAQWEKFGFSIQILEQALKG